MFDDRLIFHSPQFNTTVHHLYLQTGSLHLPHTRSMGPSTHLSIDRSGTTTPHASIHHYSYIALHPMTEDWRRHININRNPLHTITSTLPYASRSKSSSSRVNNNYGKSSTLIIIILHTRTCITMAISGTYYSIIYLAVCNVIWDIVSCVRSLVLWYGSPKWEYYGMVWWELWIEFWGGYFGLLFYYYPSW